MRQKQIELTEFGFTRISHILGLSYEHIKELASKDDEETPDELLDASSE